MKTQCDAILAYMREHGSITTFEAFEQLGITRLAARIADLKKLGIVIQSYVCSGINRYGKVVTYTRYWIVEEEGKTNG